MITIRYPGHLQRRRQAIASHVLSSPHRIPFTLKDQTGELKLLQMVDAQLQRFSQRMKGIAEAESPTNATGRSQLIQDQTGHPTTHRFPADEQWGATLNLGNHIPEALLQHRGPIRRATASRLSGTPHVGKSKTINAPPTVG